MAGIGRHQIAISMARPHAAMVETMGTWARHVPGSRTFQFLEKGLQRKDTMKMEKTIQRTLRTLQTKTARQSQGTG